MAGTMILLHNATSIFPAGQTSLDIVFQSAGECIGLSAVALEVASTGIKQPLTSTAMSLAWIWLPF